MSEPAFTPTTAGLAARLASEHLERRGIDSEPLLSQCQLSAAALADHRRISALSQVKFLELVSAATSEPCKARSARPTLDNGRDSSN